MNVRRISRAKTPSSRVWPALATLWTRPCRLLSTSREPAGRSFSREGRPVCPPWAGGPAGHPVGPELLDMVIGWGLGALGGGLWPWRWGAVGDPRLDPRK